MFIIRLNERRENVTVYYLNMLNAHNYSYSCKILRYVTLNKTSTVSYFEKLRINFFASKGCALT